jgi:hypothetical protein
LPTTSPIFKSQMFDSKFLKSTFSHSRWHRLTTRGELTAFRSYVWHLQCLHKGGGIRDIILFFFSNRWLVKKIRKSWQNPVVKCHPYPERGSIHLPLRSARLFGVYQQG